VTHMIITPEVLFVPYWKEYSDTHNSIPDVHWNQN
jgi:hypothetical protein